jgi:hypothetical protein
MNRAEHIDWVKERALEYVDAGDPTNAVASMFSDLRKHPDTQDHGALELGGMLLLAGHLSSTHDVRDFIEGIR